jgi:hypothetical protein
MAEYTREDLVAICERGFVPEDSWTDRDSSDAQRQLGQCYALLRAGCEFEVLQGKYDLKTDEHTIWVELTFKGFGYFDYDGDLSRETFYLPTVARLDARAGKDWY